MCNEDILDRESRIRREKMLSRRDFNLFAISAAAVALLPASAQARSVKETMVTIRTADGLADAFFAHPAKGRYPGVLLWPDFMGLRPAYQQLASKLAQSGYSVLAVNPYYRHARSPIIEVADFENKEAMQKFRTYSSAITLDTLSTDAKAFVGFLDRQQQVDHKSRVGTMGYCMSGAWTFHVAAALPEQVGAIASFHGGGLAADDADSPLHVMGRMRAEALIAIAEDDDAREPQAKVVLREGFERAKLRAQIEVYKAGHGWCTPDMVGLYHEAEAQRAWRRLSALFERAL